MPIVGEHGWKGQVGPNYIVGANACILGEKGSEISVGVQLTFQGAPVVDGESYPLPLVPPMAFRWHIGTLLILQLFPVEIPDMLL